MFMYPFLVLTSVSQLPAWIQQLLMPPYALTLVPLLSLKSLVNPFEINIVRFNFHAPEYQHFRALFWLVNCLTRNHGSTPFSFVLFRLSLRAIVGDTVPL